MTRDSRLSKDWTCSRSNLRCVSGMRREPSEVIHDVRHVRPTGLNVTRPGLDRCG